MTDNAKQLPLPNMPEPEKIVNVASVPHRSPFRYPGGKTWLVPRIRAWLQAQSNRPARLIEPFAGGGIVGLTVAFEELADHVMLVELDAQVAAVWQTILGDDTGLWLAEQIAEFELTRANVIRLLAEKDTSTQQQALRTIVKNRVNRGGILATGAGMLKQGENGRGIASRWYPKTLEKRIRDIVAIRDRLTFIQGDGLRMIQDYLQQPDIVFFVDPPYTAAAAGPGARLYDDSDLDHEALFDLLARATGDFLLTYNHNEQVEELATRHAFDIEPIAMKNTHHARKTELLIGRDLSWLR
jgi:DNA adenine methylase